MDFPELMASRYSCRGFLADDIPPELLGCILATAQRTPSWCNTQPWSLRVLRGDGIRRVATELRSFVENDAGALSPDVDLPEYVGPYRDRRREAGFGLYAALGIERDDHGARRRAMLENYDFFGAPVALIVTVPQSLGTYGAVDVGAYITNLMNAAWDAGIASIALGSIGMYAGKVRELLGVPEAERVLCAVALGFADARHPANAFRTTRDGVSAFATEVTS